MNCDILCQLPPEAGHPPHIAAKLINPAYGMHDAPLLPPSLLRPLRLWWNILDKALYCYGKVLTRTDRYCYVPYSIQSRKKIWNQIKYTHYHDAVFEKKLDPIAGSPATEKSVAGIIALFVKNLSGTGGGTKH